MEKKRKKNMIFLLHLTLRSRRKCRSGGFSSHSGLLRLRFPSSHTSFNSPITLIRAGYLFQVIQKWTPSQPHLSLLVCSMGKTNKRKRNKQSNKQTSKTLSGETQMEYTEDPLWCQMEKTGLIQGFHPLAEYTLCMLSWSTRHHWLEGSSQEVEMSYHL